MTPEELWNKIDAIDIDSREDGKYTYDEMYDIGCAFISMDNSQKRAFGGWDKLVETLQPLDRNGEVMKSGEAFRGWIKNQRYIKDDIIHNEHMLSGKNIDDLTFEEFEEKTEELKRGLYKQQVKTRDVMNSYRRTLREDARVEFINDLIVESIKSLKDLPKVKINTNITDDVVEAIMLLSDLHIGMQIDNFYNKYDSNIARKRVKKYVQDTIELCKRNNVQRLNVLNLGDLIAGNIHVTGRIEASEDLISQIMIASEILAEALNDLQEAAPEIIYRSCSDNHSRVTPDFRANLEPENYFRLIDFYLEARLKDTNVQIIHDNLDVDLGFFELLNGQKLAFAHGHRDNVNTALQGVLGATKQFVDYVCVGHFHESKLKSFQGAKVFVNSSICGADSYAQSKRLYGIPEQTLLILENNNLSVNYINLNIQ